MMSWLSQNIGTIIIALIVIAIVVIVIRKMRKDKKNGSSCGCGGSCSGCAMNGKCHGDKK